MRNHRLFMALVALAVAIKIFLFIFSAVWLPQMKIEPDSVGYLQMAEDLFAKGAFVKQDGSMQPEVYRTPGYPVFLGLLHDLGRIPLNGVVFLQVLLTLLSAWLTYKIAQRVDVRIAALSGLIVLFDVPGTVWSLRIMTEALYTFLFVLMILAFVSYLKKANVKSLLCSALLLILATYVRPVSYFLGIPIAGFILYANAPKNMRKAVAHAVIFLTVVFGLLGLWSLRNWQCARTMTFAAVSTENQQVFSIFGSYAQERYPQRPGVPDLLYYAEITARSFQTMMFNPGSWKYFQNPILSPIGKVFAYLLMLFWMAGFLVGIFKARRDVYCQFFFLVSSYFILVTVYNVGLVGNERFRVVIMPCIAIISAYGWLSLWPGKKDKF